MKAFIDGRAMLGGAPLPMVSIVPKCVGAVFGVVGVPLLLRREGGSITGTIIVGHS